MTSPSEDHGKWRNILLIAVAVTLSLSLWFAGSAVVPQLTTEWSLTARQQSWITMSVQLGFVVGALLSALFNLADRVPTRRLFAVSSGLAAVATLAMVFMETFGGAILSRFATGVLLAGVYPPGMKLMAGWTRRDRGLGIGILVGALTLGSAMPHLLNALSPGSSAGMPAWRTVLWITAAQAAAASTVAIAFVRDGPYLIRSAPFDWRFLPRSLAHRPTRLANLGYLGHMWELYAMWTWVPIYLLTSYERSGLDLRVGRLAGFATIGIGAVGCILAGYLADRWGRTLIAGWSLAISGCCCLLAGSVFDRPFLLTMICLLWGVSVIADSAQFSAAITELTDSRYMGTALTLQTCLGFSLTLLSIRLIPELASWLGWRWVFVALVLGPIVGIWSMWRLRRLPASLQMATGRR